MHTDVKEPTMPEGKFGLDSAILLMIAIREKGIWVEQLEDDPNLCIDALHALHARGWELEKKPCGRICAARDADAPVPGYKNYWEYMWRRVVTDHQFWQSVVAYELLERNALYVERADRHIERILEPFLRRGEDTLPPLSQPFADDEEFEDFDVNAFIRDALAQNAIAPASAIAN
jgi:hypothetical protein